jgi:hypothetical protein
MKKLLLLFPVCFIMISCEKESSEIPGWIKDKIAIDEQVIASNTQSELAVAAWIRYRFNGHYYFEYQNLLSSAGPDIHNYDGDQINPEQKLYLNFEKDKCCKEYIWKGPLYIEL